MCILPTLLIAADAVLEFEGNLPADTTVNYPTVNSGVANRSVTATQGTWVNYTGGGAFGGIQAVNAGDRQNITLTRGSMTGNDSATFSADNSEVGAVQLTSGITAATIWFYNSRTQVTATGVFADVGTVYLAGGQLWLTTDGIVIPSAVISPVTRYDGDSANEFYKAALRVSATGSVIEKAAILPDAGNETIVTFQSGKGLTINTLSGAGNLTIKTYWENTNYSLAINKLENYTGTIRLTDRTPGTPSRKENTASATLALGAEIGSAPKIIQSIGTFKPPPRSPWLPALPSPAAPSTSARSPSPKIRRFSPCLISPSPATPASPSTSPKPAAPSPKPSSAATTAKTAPAPSPETEAPSPGGFL